MPTEQTVHTEDRRLQILEYLRDKYQEPFDIIGKIGQARGVPGDLWGAKPQNGSDQDTFTVTGNITTDGYLLKDSYYSIYILPKYKEFVASLICKVIDKYLLSIAIVKTVSNSDELTKEVSVQDIYKYNTKDELFRTKVMIAIPKSVVEASEGEGKNFDKIVLELCQLIKDSKLIAWIKFLVIEEEEYHKLLSSNDLQSDFIKVKKIYTASYSIDHNYNIINNEEVFKEIKDRYKESFNKVNDNLNNIDEKIVNEKEINYEISKWQIERLCCLIYLDSLTNNLEIGNLSDILSYMITFSYDDSRICKKLPNEMTKDEWDVVLMDILSDLYLSSLKIVKCVNISEKTKPSKDVLPGHKAVCFMDDCHRAYIIYRGTYGDKEWYDDAKGLLVAETIQQKAALKFVLDIREDEDLDVRMLTVAGHSKGGNKAQYVMISAPEGYVDRCVSINGQGFSTKFIHKYKYHLSKRASKMELIAEQRDFVNCLGIYIGKTMYYRGRRGEHTNEYPYGQPLSYFHSPDSLRKIDGSIGEESEHSYISKVINILFERFLNDEKYTKIRRKTILNVISLMMKKKIATSAEIAEAIKDLMLIFFELTAGEEIFSESMIQLLNQEPDLLIATIGMITSMDNNEVSDEEVESIGKLVRTKLAKSLITNSDNMYNFNIFIKKIIKLMKLLIFEMKSEPKIVNYLYVFVSSMLEYMIENSSVAGKLIAKRLLSNFLKLKEDAELEPSKNKIYLMK